MSWNYRIVRYRNRKAGYGLHEVYYDDDGKPWAMTQEPASVAAMTPDEIRGDLMLMQADARKRPILDEPKKWPGKAP